MALVRSLAPPHQGHRYRLDDTIALYRCAEPTSSVCVDLTATRSMTTNVNAVGVAPSLFFNSGTLGARTFNGTNQRQYAFYSAGASLNSLIADLQGNWAIESWINWAGAAGTGTIYEYAGGLSATESLNAQISLQVTTDGRLRMTWEQGAGVVVTVQTDPGAVVAGVTAHVAAVKGDDPVTAGRKTVTFYVNGVQLGATFVGLVNATGTGSSSCDLQIGSSTMNYSIGTPGDYFAGSISEIRLTRVALTAEAIRDSYARGQRDWDEAVLLTTRRYKVQQRVLVQDQVGDWRDLAAQYGRDFVIGTKISDDKEDDGPSATVKLRRESFKFSLAPWMTLSPFNTGGGGTLLEARRQIKIERATVPDGRPVEPWMWQTRFEGFVDKVAWGANPITLEARATQVPLQDTYMAEEEDFNALDYGALSTLLEAQVQRLIDYWIPGSLRNPSPTAGYKGQPTTTSTPKVWAPVSSAWAITQYRQKQESVWDGANTLTEQIGWQLRSSWDEHRQAFRIKLYEPPRTKTLSEYTLTAGQVLALDALEYSADQVRNKVRVYYGDALLLDFTGEPIRAYVDAQDAVSIAKFGLMGAAIGEATSANVDTAAEAQRLADAFIYDCAEPKADASATTRYMPHVECDDLYTLAPDGRHLDVAQDLAVVGWSDTVEAGKAKTEITLRGKPKGRVRRHWSGIIGKGLHPQLRKFPLAQPVVSTIEALLGGLHIRWNPRVGRLNRAHDRTEVHVSPNPAFVASASTRRNVTRSTEATITGLDPNQPWYVKIVDRDLRDGTSPESLPVNGIPRFTGVASTPRFRVRVAAVQAVAAGKTTGQRVIFGTTELDANTDTDTSAARTLFTAPVTGDYRFEVLLTVGFNGASDLSDTVDVALFKNATANGTANGVLLGTAPQPMPATTVQAHLVCTVPLVIGDTVCVKVSTEYSRGLTTEIGVGSAASWFAGELIGQP